MKRIGILGGTFNPIHLGHLLIAQAAQEHCNLEKVIFIPSFLPPHKKVTGLVPVVHRLNMVRVAIKGNQGFEVSDFEIEKGGKSYSINTARYLRSVYTQRTALYYIIGEDSATDLQTWKSIEQLVQLVTFIVVNRPGHIRKKGTVPYHSVTMPGIDISSSYIRKRIIQGKSVRYLIPENVDTYIQKHKLFRK